MNIESLLSSRDATIAALRFHSLDLRSSAIAQRASESRDDDPDNSDVEDFEFFDSVREREIRQSVRYPYRHLDFGQLQSSAHTCRLCEVLLSALKRPTTWSGRDRPSVKDEWLVHVGLQLYPNSKGPHIILSAQSPESGLSGRIIFANLLVYTCEDDPTTRLGLRPLRLLPWNTRSEASFKTARMWISDCIEEREHHCMTDNIGSQPVCNTVRPQRLIHVSRSSDELLLRLIDGKTINEPYAALSHCWGPGPWTWITRKSNISTRGCGFVGGELPPCVRDACLVALNLDIPHVWIACLCIIQDDEDDWASEAQCMASIYNGSVVTIAASAARSSQDELFNPKSSSSLPHPSTFEAVECTLSSGAKSTLRFVPDDYDTAFRDEVFETTLAQRAWVCQERLSSRRILHYTASQLFWECEHCLLSEDNAHHGVGPWITCESRMAILSLYRFVDLPPNMSTNAVCGKWYKRIVSLYSGCKLTFPDDKLHAISGLAKLIHDKLNVPYLAGHWHAGDRNLLQSLCWQRVGNGSKGSVYRAPSWSWASQDSAVEWMIGDWTEKWCSNLERAAIAHKDAGSSPYGSVSGGEVVITAPLSQHTLYPRGGGVDDENAIPIHGRGDAELDCVDYPSPMSVYALAMDCSIQYLLLAPVEPGSEVMQRIGAGNYHLGHWPLEYSTKRNAFMDKLVNAPLRTVTII